MNSAMTPEEEFNTKFKSIVMWLMIATLVVIALVIMFSLLTEPTYPFPEGQQQKSTVIGGCDESLWQHTYHSQRLQVKERCAAVTGIIVDASHRKHKDGCRHEADGDGHCFLKLDAGQEKYINEMNVKNESGNLVFEPECRYQVKQEDAKASCYKWKQQLKLAPVGAHVRVIGAWVLDTAHGHEEIHPVSSIEVLK